LESKVIKIPEDRSGIMTSMNVRNGCLFSFSYISRRKRLILLMKPDRDRAREEWPRDEECPPPPKPLKKELELRA